MRTVLHGLALLGEVILVALAIPVAILVVGAPIVLVVRLVLEGVRAL